MFQHDTSTHTTHDMNVLGTAKVSRLIYTLQKK